MTDCDAGDNARPRDWFENTNRARHGVDRWIGRTANWSFLGMDKGDKIKKTVSPKPGDEGRGKGT